jgi:hypothetical protein
MTTDLPAVAENADNAPEGGVAAVSPRVRICPECGVEFSPPTKGPGQGKRICTTEHRYAWQNREIAEGKLLVTIAKAWRKTRGSGTLGKRAFSEMTAILDALNARDVEAKRPTISERGIGPLRQYLDDVLAEPFMDRDRPHVRRKRKA